jgi:23S rRNA pseudouridine1911/1915/1917 synthase
VPHARVPADAAGLRLDRFLAGLQAIGSRAVAERLIGGGKVDVDGERRPKSHRLAGGEKVSWEQLPDAGLEPGDGDLPEVRIAWQDEHVLIVDKLAGVVVHAGAATRAATLADALRTHGAEGGPPERSGIVHRLDRDTSGLLVVARSEEAHRRLQGLVRRRRVEREYVALVRGRPRSWRGTIEAPIGRDRRDPTRQSLDTDSPRPAVTHFAVEELLSEHALLQVRLETGRTHQIRVHLAAIELPVVGDPTYGVPDLGLERQFLHACRLAFPHPFSGDPVEVTSPLPPDLEAALATARG